MRASPVIVTRPAREAARWVDELRGGGIDARALPLIGIEAVQHTEALRAAWLRLPEYAALMFVSAAAVEHFFRRKEAVLPVQQANEAINSGANQRCWATGPGTARALQHAGIHLSAIDAPPAQADRFDSEALWALVQQQVRPGTRVLIVRGGDGQGRPTGRDWLGDQIDAAGGLRDTVVAYRRLAPVFGEAELTLAVEGVAGRAIWLFSSSEAIMNLQRALPATSWKNARAIATHPRIAQAAEAAGFGAVRLAPPLRPALIASIESFQ